MPNADKVHHICSARPRVADIDRIYWDAKMKTLKGVDPYVAYLEMMNEAEKYGCDQTKMIESWAESHELKLWEIPLKTTIEAKPSSDKEHILLNMLLKKQQELARVKTSTRRIFIAISCLCTPLFFVIPSYPPWYVYLLLAVPVWLVFFGFVSIITEWTYWKQYRLWKNQNCK